MKYGKLLSGSDLRGVAIASEGKPVTLTEDAAKRAAFCFANWLAERLGENQGAKALCIAVGHDSRLSAHALKGAVLAGLAGAGATVLDCGLCTTPAMFMTTRDAELNCRGAVMITASHLPMDRNGLKFMTEQGGLESGAARELTRRMETAEVPVRAVALETVSQLERYSLVLCDLIRKGIGEEKPLSGLQLAVDAGNGASGFYAEKVLRPLGADTSGSQFLEPDGHFPNHAPNPEDGAAMEAISGAVLKSGADLGIIFDADGDRAAIVDATGRAINRNRLVALVSAMLLRDAPGGHIVTDSITSRGLASFIARKGGVHVRFKRGYKNVIDESRRLNAEGLDSPLAIETSGHAALRENYFLDDGAYLVSRLLIEAARMRRAGGDLMDLIAELEEPVEERELRIQITHEDFRPYGQAAIDRLEQAASADPAAHIATDSREGIRVSFDLDGRADAAWLLLRLSVHDPVLPMNIESDVPGGCDALQAWAREALAGCECLELSVLNP